MKNQKALEAILSNSAYPLSIITFDDSTRTAADAANAIGCTVGQIAKSIIFKTSETHEAILVIASGTNRVNEQKIAAYVGEALQKADADFVLQETGFVIGGVPPVGHIKEIRTFIDQDLLQYEEIWAAAGSSHSVFKLTPEILKSITKGTVISIT